MNLLNKKEFKLGIAVSSMVSILLFALIIKYYQNNQKIIDDTEYITIITVSEDAATGTKLTNDKLIEKKVDSQYIVKQDLLANLKDFEQNQITANTIFAGEPIYKKDIINIDVEYQDMIPFAVQVNTLATVANSVKIGDYVDLCVTNGNISNTSPKIILDNGEIDYKDYFTVVSHKKIADLRNEQGQSIKGMTNVLPHYAIIYFSSEELQDYINAFGTGTIFFGLYTDTTKPRETNYVRKENLYE